MALFAGRVYPGLFALPSVRIGRSAAESTHQLGRTLMAYLEITLKINDAERPAAAGVYTKYKQPFLDTIAGATSKDLLIREDDVQVLHGFDTAANAQAYLSSELFVNDVVRELGPLLQADPEIRVYETA